MHVSRLSGARPCLLAAALVLVAAADPAGANGSTMDGVRGLMRIPSADPAPTGQLGGGVWGSYARSAYDAAESLRGRPETIKFGGSRVSVSYAPASFLELALRGTAESQFLTSGAAVSENEFGLSQLGFGVRTLLTPGPNRAFRVAALVDVASSLGSANALAGSWDNDGVNVAGRLAFTYAPADAHSRRALRAHAMAGYSNQTSDFDMQAWALSAVGPTPARSVLAGDSFHYGLGLEYPANRDWTLFTEFTGDYDIESEAEFPDNPMRVTPGFRWSAPGGALAWTSGVDVSLANEEAGPSWEIISGISFGSYLVPVTGRVLGVVRDAESGAPIANAQVSRRDGAESAMTDTEGRFRASFEEGFAVLEVSAPGYVTKTRVVEIHPDAQAELDLTLPKRVVLGSVEGHLRDAKSGAAVAGRVRVQGSTEWTTADAATGVFRLSGVPAGSATLEVESDEHSTTTSSVEVSAGDVTTHDIALVADPFASHGRLAGVVTDAATGAPLPALITARGPATKSAQSDPATGRYEIVLEPGQWEIVVAGQGHAARRESLRVAERDRQSRDWPLDSVPPQVALEGVVFEEGTATIKRASLTALDEAAKFLIDNPSLHVVIEGHTDDVGSPSTNLALSQRRADAVLKYLVINHGVDPSRLDARGVGADRPVAPNDTPENRAKNRRIELLVETAK